MDPQTTGDLIMLTAIVTPMVLVAWIVTTWMKVRHGYALGFGRNNLPAPTSEVAERLALASQENAQLRAEVGAVKDRLATVERIVTDRSFTLDHEIERLRGPAN